jgi:hypothetical protein
MACSSAEGRQKARRFQYHGARKKGPGGTEESAPEIGRTHICVSARRPGWRSAAETATHLHGRLAYGRSYFDNWFLIVVSDLEHNIMKPRELTSVSHVSPEATRQFLAGSRVATCPAQFPSKRVRPLLRHGPIRLHRMTQTEPLSSGDMLAWRTFRHIEPPLAASRPQASQCL